MSVREYYIRNVVEKTKKATVLAVCKECKTTYLVDITFKNGIHHNSWEGFSITPKPTPCSKCRFLIKELFFFHNNTSDRGGNSPGKLKEYIFILTDKVGSISSEFGICGTFSIKQSCVLAA